MSIHHISSLLITSLNLFGCSDSSKEEKSPSLVKENAEDAGKITDVGPEIPQGEGEVVPAEREICDGLDDDNDGETDEGVKNPCGYCGVIPREVICDWRVVGDGRRVSMHPVLAWNDLKSEFGLIWVEGGEVSPTEIRFLKIDANGNTIGKEKVLARNLAQDMPVAHMPPTFVWGGSVYAMSWEEADSAYFGIFDQNGNQVNEPQPISSQALIAWTGTEFGAVHGRSRSDYRFQRFDVSGSKLGDEKSVGEDIFADAHEPWYPVPTSLAWANSLTEYGLAWWHMDNWEGRFKLYFSRLDENGQEAGEDLKVFEVSMEPTGAQPEGPTLTWNGEVYGMKWDDENYIHFTELNSQGAISAEIMNFDLGPIMMGGYIRSDSGVSWASNFYGVTWSLQGWDMAGRGVFFNKIIRSENRLTDLERRISNAESGPVGGGFSPAMAWNGRHFGIAWVDDRLDRGNIFQGSIYFTLIDP